MARKNKTRDGTNAQKKSVCLSVFPFVEADVLGEGSVYVNLPKRSVITHIHKNVITASSTPSAGIIVLIDNNTLTTSLEVANVGVTSVPLTAIFQYFEAGGKLGIVAGSTPPADGALMGELLIEYYELDKSTGEYTTFLDS